MLLSLRSNQLRTFVHRSALLAAIVLVPSAPALAPTTAPTWYGPEWMWWWGPIHMLMPMLLFGLLIVGVILLFRKLWPDQERDTSSGRALQLLDERYAKGEIEREEYLRRRQDILVFCPIHKIPAWRRIDLANGA